MLEEEVESKGSVLRKSIGMSSAGRNVGAAPTPGPSSTISSTFDQDLICTKSPPWPTRQHRHHQDRLIASSRSQDHVAARAPRSAGARTFSCSPPLDGMLMTWLLSSQFYNDSEASKYTSSSRIQSIQSEMALRCLELLSLPVDPSTGEPLPQMILDIGCGSGLSGEVIEEQGHEWVGMDISGSMLGASTSLFATKTSSNVA